MEIRDLTSLPVHIFEEAIADNQHANIPFAWTETFLKMINQEPDAILLHIWPMEKTVILGMLDKLLPNLSEAKSVIENNGYQPVVRNIGGLAVVADEGILNFSFIIPDTFKDAISITDGYLIMVDFIKMLFSDLHKRIDYFEIEDSYCPGNYDLSIDGKKFAGIAQRRIKKGIVVSIYLSVSGNQEERGQMIADFYQKGLAGQTTKVSYPKVNPSSMANLSDLFEVPFTVDEVIERISLTLRQLGFSIKNWQPNQIQKEQFDLHYQKMTNNKN
ncbi:lipoate--protein ligase family protein [Streptococcus pacificus]|uniref:Lipoate--protein ligase family protein n=1 Tax=Streptococcus pacificus TaxID=2740577 RepID=A0ABS0ZHA0_9STRE|nr:lipoate--protein ligase family protein [Streptococcus pacificus]MBJ8325376.1 lipoate--protein ligase family protein [Streptococcus pacificus]